MLQLEWGLKWVAELQVVPDYILQRGVVVVVVMGFLRQVEAECEPGQVFTPVISTEPANQAPWKAEVGRVRVRG